MAELSASEFNHGKGLRPNPVDYGSEILGKRDQIEAMKQVMRTDPADPAAQLEDSTTVYVGRDQFGRPWPTLEERGYTRPVRENPNADRNARVDPTLPGPNEWRDPEVSDPLRTGWENGNFDPDVNANSVPGKGKYLGLPPAVGNPVLANRKNGRVPTPKLKRWYN